MLKSISEPIYWLNKCTFKKTLEYGVIIYSLYLVFKLLKSDFKYGWKSNEQSDWLINYQGGFVHRGLAGELFYGFYLVLRINNYTNFISANLLYLTLFIFLAIQFFNKKDYSCFLHYSCLTGEIFNGSIPGQFKSVFKSI